MNQYEEEVISTLKKLGIVFSLKEHAEMVSMDEYETIEKELSCMVPKNLFLCNQQHTKFYLLLMPGNKKFKTKGLSKQINSARLSFASDDELDEDMHCFKGSTSVFGLLFDKKNNVQLLIDEDLLNNEYLGFHPCVNTMTIRIKKKDLIDVFLPYVSHEFIKVKLIGD